MTLETEPGTGTVSSELILPADTEYLAFWFWWNGLLGDPQNWYKPDASTRLEPREQAAIFAGILATETRT